ncbi:TadE/TadG family type IV pilus assembly protein [Paenibacillus farraposensis]|uniref:TadE/TadG family type IV pilus assembly protein n=1 Tax=Paenibacillus farraposensis TaxID=2807095 RepID=UPI00361CB968
MFGKERNTKDRESGAVTVFLILILAVMLGFIAVFIDYARIAALHVQTERLAHAAVRSVMSAYDPVLQQEYGLFAYGKGGEELIMAKVLNDSAKRTAHTETLPLMNIKLDSSSLQIERELGHYAIFNEQIREEMKYKAPVDFTLEVLEKLKPLSQNMKEASHTVDVLKRLQKLYDQRETKLDDMLEKQHEAGARIEKIRKRMIKQRGVYIPNQYIWDPLEVAADIAAQYKHYVHVYEDHKKAWMTLKSCSWRNMQGERNQRLTAFVMLWFRLRKSMISCFWKPRSC